MAELVIFSIPALVYLWVQSRGDGRTARAALGRLGARWGAPAHYGLAALILVPGVLAAWATLRVIPPELLDEPGITIARLTSVWAAIGVAARALGEEILFRGLIGGVLIRRRGFLLGNTLQSLVFLAPHLLLLGVDARVWPVLPVQFALGWLLGWLRHRSGSFVPGALVHAAANLIAGVLPV